MDNTYIAIMAGGIGSRFWPQSRASYPKQFLDILGIGKTLIQATYERFARIVPEENIYIITGNNYVDLVKAQLPSIQDFQILAEPSRKNTGPCVAYMAYKLAAIDPYANFVVAPSDHLILDEANFAQVVNKAVNFANQYDVLLTLGIRPTRPDTGYGYIQYLEDLEEEGVFKVKTFTEKPNFQLAQTFLRSGDFLWNAGIFIWNVQSILAAFRKYQLEISEVFEEGLENGYFNTYQEPIFIASAYSQCKNISIDYAIMEYANNVHVIPANFGWSDLGTWTSLWERHQKDAQGNAVAGKNVLTYDTQDCVIRTTENKLVIVQGLEDYCVVDTEDVLLICKLDEEQRIKSFNMDVKQKLGRKFL